MSTEPSRLDQLTADLERVFHSYEDCMGYVVFFGFDSNPGDTKGLMAAACLNSDVEAFRFISMAICNQPELALAVHVALAVATDIETGKLPGPISTDDVASHNTRRKEEK